MTEILKIAGAALALLCALVFSREYERFLNERISFCRGFLSMLKHIRQKIDCYLTPADRLLDGFDDPTLSSSGYSESAKKLGVCRAYFEKKGEMRLPEEAEKILTSFFSDFGKEYRDGTLKLIDGAVAELEDFVTRKSGENERELRVGRTVAAAAALGIVILLV